MDGSSERPITKCAAESLSEGGLFSEGAAQDVAVLGSFCNETHGVPARDLTVAAVRAYAAMVGAAPRTLTCVDALAGCGLRAVRLALEVAVSHARRDKATNIHPAPHTVVRIWAVIAARGRAQEALQVISLHS